MQVATSTGAPGGTRTPGLQLRRLLLYPVELQAPDFLLTLFQGFVNLKRRKRIAFYGAL